MRSGYGTDARADRTGDARVFVSAILLAAGASRRMGRPKQLLKFGRGTMLEEAIEPLLRSRVREVLVVLGHRADEIRRSIAMLPVRVAINSDPDRGMLSSVQCGVMAASADADAFLVALGDQPFLCAHVIDALIRAFKDSHRGIVVPVWMGRRGHPIILDARYASCILGMGQAGTLRDVVRAHADDVLEVSVGTEDILRDMDTPEEYEEARRKFVRR